jgi:imidazolonepropionase-like amidohydrolase
MRARLPWVLGPSALVFAILAACAPAARSVPKGEVALAAWPPVPGAPAGVTVFVDVAVVPMDTERVLTGQTVLVQDGWIRALGPATAVEVPAGAVRIDGRGKYLMPGLTDMHAHLYANMESKDTNDSVKVERLLFSWLAGGVTTVRNLDWQFRRHGEHSLRWRARAAAGGVWSPRIYTSGLWSDSVPIRSVKPEQVAQYVAGYKAAGYDFIKIHGSAETGELFDSLAAAAHRLGVPLVGHVARWPSAGEEPFDRAVRARMKSIEHLTGYVAYLYRKHVQPGWTDDGLDPGRRLDVLDALAQRSDAIQPTIDTLALAARRAQVWNSPTLAIERNWFNTRMVRALQEAGAGLLLATDSPFFRANVASELRALVEAGLTPYQALVTGTRNPAAYFGTLDETGTIAVGKRADLVLLRGDPLADIRNVAQPAGVMIGGRWLSRTEIDQHLATIKAAEEAAKRIQFQLEFARSRIVFAAGGMQAAAGFSSAAYLAQNLVPKEPAQASVVLVTGLYSVDAIDEPLQERLRDKILVYVVPTGVDSALRRLSIELLRSNTAGSGMVILSTEDSAAFAGPLRAGLPYAVVRRDAPDLGQVAWAASVRAEAVAGLRDVLAAGGLDLERARAETIPTVRELPALRVAFEPQIHESLPRLDP